MKNIGLYFGTFNPVHVGHLIIANHMAEYSDLDQVWMVVTPRNPMKKKHSLLPDYHRLEMVYQATEDYDKIKPSDVEFKLPQPNYTIDTLVHISEKYPLDKFSLIMGQDNLANFDKWKNFETILEYHQIYVYPRVCQESVKTVFKNDSRIHQVVAPIIQISSSLIRQGIKNKKNVKPLLPPAVWKYIDKMNFYTQNI